MKNVTSEKKQTISNYTGSKEKESDSKGVEPSDHAISDALLGKDPPIEVAHPGLQPALVFLAYPIALILLASLIGMYFLFTQKSGRQGEEVTPATQSTSDVSTKR